ncbi:hypothetical protein GALL_134800 [mine drainage metagenome]|uniref:Uncharacterized protein n=1 Tax=mine drainage metagenome TaxID=410659 RepID=A0A1J5SJS5_9ZZZZ
MAHDQGAENVGARRDLVVHDPELRLELVVVAAQLIERADGLVAGAVGVVDGRAVRGLLAVPHREAVGDGEGFAVANDHAEDRVVGNPGPNPGVHAHAREADLVSRPLLVLVRIGRQPLLMRAPAQFRRRRALLAETLDRPGVHKLVDLLGLVGDLCVALAAVDDLHPQRLGEQVELPVLDQLADLLGLFGLQLLLGDRGQSDVDQALLGEMRDQTGIRTVFDHRRGALLLPLGGHPAEIHVTPVERALGRMLVGRARIRVPELHGGVDVADAAVVAPLQDLTCVDVPSEVDQDIPCRKMLAQQAVEVVLRHAILHEADALGGPLLQLLGAILKIHDRHIPRGDLDVLEEDGEGAFGDGAVADEEDLGAEFDHDNSTGVGRRFRLGLWDLRCCRPSRPRQKVRGKQGHFLRTASTIEARHTKLALPSITAPSREPCGAVEKQKGGRPDGPSAFQIGTCSRLSASRTGSACGRRADRPSCAPSHGNRA